MAFVCQMLAAYIPPGAPPGGFLTMKPCVKITDCIPGVVLDPLHQVTSWVREQSSTPGKDLKPREVWGLVKPEHCGGSWDHSDTWFGLPPPKLFPTALLL
jgi:hypothetical protein